MKPDMIPDILAAMGLAGFCSGIYFLAGLPWALTTGGALSLALGLYLAHRRAS